jgi:tetratricopeptide (TPR) repeat protein
MNDTGGAEFSGTERFAVVRRIGAGGMGVVYEAHDRQRNESVALKTLPQLRADTLYYLKQEFRALSGVSHPNLAALYELFAVGEQWFFTMELVRGVNFLQYVCPALPPASAVESTVSYLPPGPGLSETADPGTRTVLAVEAAAPAAPPGPEPRAAPQFGRLRAALAQLAEGVCALHATGKLHRDIKPSNVLVTPQGRVVLLDFGLVTELEQPPGLAAEQEVAGTFTYMAPEQATGGPLSPASDWYSVGVMLYEALTGRRPFLGSRSQILKDKLSAEPWPPRTFAPGVPEDLDALCQQLLRRRPEERPTGADVLRRLGAAAAVPEEVAVPRPAGGRGPFVGREHYLGALADAYRATRAGRAVTVYVRGRSGVGKSLLVQRFLEDLAGREEAVVLAGRCYECESVPYKALDSLVDALSRYLARLPPAEADALVPRDVPALARLFPVLRRVEAVAAAQRRGFEVPNQQELRRRGFAALRELLARLGARRPLALFIDDLQWGDVDSAALLSDLLRPPDPPTLLLLGSYRSEYAATSPCLQGLLAARPATDCRDLAVEPLAPAEAQRLARELLGPAAAGAEAVARESGGNPYFIHELVQHLQGGAELAGRPAGTAEVTLDDVLWKRVARLPEAARRLLEAVTVSGRPLPQAAAYQAAALGAAEDRAALAVLRAGHLVRSTGPGGQDEIETYHDRIRETVAAHLPPPSLRAYHGRLAVTLEAAGRADPETLAVHYQGAGDGPTAGRYFALAADEAAEALAFDRAAKLYRLALALRPGTADEGRALRTRLGDALANAGRGVEAAREYQAAAAAAGADEALELQRRAAFQYCISGHLDEGRAAFRVVLGAVGMRLPPTPRRALLSALTGRALLRLRGLRFRERSAAQIPLRDLLRIDIVRSVAVGISAMDPLCGAGFQARSMVLALRAGEPLRIALALAWEASHSALGGGPTQKRTDRLLEAAQSLAGRLNHPHALGMATLAAGIRDFFLGRFRPAGEFCERAEAIFREQCTGVMWELDTAHAFGLWSLLYRGELGQLRRRFFVLFKEATERGDRYDAANLGTQIGTLARLAAGEVEEARDLLREVMGHWTTEGFNIQHLSALYGRIYIDLYTGSGATAWERIPRMWSECRRSLLLRIQQIYIDVLQLSGRSALAAAAAAADPRPLLRAAEGYARRLERLRMPWSVALAGLLRAGAAAGRRDAALAVRLYGEAAAALDAVPLGVFAAAARRRQGELLGGDAGRALVEAADAWMRDRQVHDPARLAAAFAPGPR